MDASGLDEAAQLLVAARYVVALVGAGMSVESGIPPFRGSGGLWTRFGEPDMRGYQRFLEDPKGWWQGRDRPQSHMREMAQVMEHAQPNPGHHALAELEALGILKCLITQNIDNLHHGAGSRRVVEIHGNRFKLRCISCHSRWWREEFPIHELPPRCPHCSGLVKTDTVMFGEPIPPDALDACYHEAAQCDGMLIIGTSAVVYPAAEMPLIARRGGAWLMEINPDATPLTAMCRFTLRGSSGSLLPLLVEKVKGLQASGPPPIQDKEAKNEAKNNR
ncbi:MAG: NAD-dependent deacylase [Chloroflexi bacterium]|nr:NAD-dependent deacylase [Chloroflexota bacterium]